MENPPNKKLDVYAKKEQITNVFAKENDEQSAMNIQMSMDIQVKKFIDTYNEESPPDKKIDVYGKKEQIAEVYDS